MSSASVPQRKHETSDLKLLGLTLCESLLHTLHYEINRRSTHKQNIITGWVTLNVKLLCAVCILCTVHGAVAAMLHIERDNQAASRSVEVKSVIQTDAYKNPHPFTCTFLLPALQSPGGAARPQREGKLRATLLIRALFFPVVRAPVFEQCCCLLCVCSFRNKHLPERTAAAANKLSQEVLLIG